LFDKTRNISGHPIEIAGTINSLAKVKSLDGRVFLRDPFEPYKIVIKILWKAIGAKTNYTMIPVKDIGVIFNNGTATGITKDVLQGKYESRDIEDFQRHIWRNELNLYTKMDLCYITQKIPRSIIDQLSEIFTSKIIGLLLFSFMAIIFLLAHLLNASYIHITLDVIAAISGFSMIRQPTTEFNKVSFIWIVFSFMILSTTLQSQLSAIISSPQVFFVDIKEVQYLVDNNYKVYSSNYYLQFFYNTILEDKIHITINYSDCLDYVSTDSKICCIQACRVAKYSINDKDLIHMSEQNLNTYRVILFRDDSPFIKRMKIIYESIYESGIVHFIEGLQRYQYKHQSDNKFKTISFSQLEYSFLFLAYSHTISIVIFVVEILYKKLHLY
jgi:hypothetical protein